MSSATVQGKKSSANPDLVPSLKAKRRDASRAATDTLFLVDKEDAKDLPRSPRAGSRTEGDRGRRMTNGARAEVPGEKGEKVNNAHDYYLVERIS